jgi:hypothetical protein
VRSILSFAPLDLVDLLFDFEGLQVVEFGLVRLELGMELVFARLFLISTSAAFTSLRGSSNTYSLVPLEEHHAATLVTGG